MAQALSYLYIYPQITSLGKYLRSHPLQSPDTYLQLPAVHLSSRTFHHPANPLYQVILLSHPFSTHGQFSFHVLQANHIHRCTISLEWPATWTPHFSFTSIIIIASKGKPSSLSGSSIYQDIGTQSTPYRNHGFALSIKDSRNFASRPLYGALTSDCWNFIKARLILFNL